MTKRLRLISAFLLAVALPMLTACLSDDAVDGSEARQDGKITVHLRLSQAGSTAMRATWDDLYAEDKEMMNVWVVVAVKAPDNGEGEDVVGIWACKPSGESDKEIDDTEKIITASFDKNQRYHFYSFANMSPAKVMELLGITATDAITNYMTNETSENNVTQFDVPNEAKVNYNATMEKTVSMAGNNFNKFNSGDNNGFGSYGIPMSNVQTFTSLQDNDIKDLVVVRMLAKIKLEITNTSSESVTIESVTLTDITKNETSKDNLKLFPKYTSTEIPNGEDLKEGYEHGDIQPNLNTGTTTEDVTVTVGKTIDSRGKEDVIFYVNESATPTTNEFKHFFLKLKLSKDGEEATEERYALIDDKGTKENEKWDYIARNDYRIIPISLDDFKFELIPYDFPAIGVHPASIKEEGGLYTITFHDYGHFHLLPKVTKFTASGATAVNYGTEQNTWSLQGGTFNSAWKSWNDHNKQSDSNVASFYGKDTSADEKGNAIEDDANDAGGMPVWYLNDNTKSQWDPAGGTNYQPFIFGYIADPEDKLTTDRKVYHEFTIQINKGGSVTYPLIYRLYMILDTDQMLYRNNGAAPVRHTYGH